MFYLKEILTAIKLPSTFYRKSKELIIPIRIYNVNCQSITIYQPIQLLQAIGKVDITEKKCKLAHAKHSSLHNLMKISLQLLNEITSAFILLGKTKFLSTHINS